MSKIFAKGISFKRPHDKTPEYVKGSLSIKTDEFIKFLQANSTNGWVNLDLKESKDNKLYFELNVWNRSKEKGKRLTKNNDENITELEEEFFDIDILSKN